MRLEGSCQCGKVRFTAESETPVPFMYCFCSICRKCSGGAFGCNIMARADTLKVTGRRFMRAYHARIRKAGKPTRISEGSRWFCTACGTHLWVSDKRWPDGIWPNVAAIDSELPPAPEHVHMMTAYKPGWVPERLLENGAHFPEYPELSIMAWHEQRGLRQPVPAAERKPAKKSAAKKKRRAAA